MTSVIGAEEAPGPRIAPGDGALRDTYGRVAKKLRIQVTDRCNYSCDFCMPPDPVWLDRSELLSFEEITRIARVLAGMGVERVRLSGGEPLVRSDLEKLIGALTSIPGIRSVRLTTNGSMLKEKAAKLRDSGLSGVTVSLHSLRPERYDSITGVPGMLSRVLDGIGEARKAGLPVKVNCVVRRHSNEDEVLDFARLARSWGVPVRFIEYMPFDGKRFWDMEKVVSGAEVVKVVGSVYDLVQVPREPGATSESYRFADGSKGEIGTVSSMTKPFCLDCDRIRLTADGKLVPCLFSNNEYDVRSLLREGAGDQEISEYVRKCFWLKPEGVGAMIRQNVTFGRVRPMNTIGG